MSELTDKEIEAGWHKTFSTSNPFCPVDQKSFGKCVRWAESTMREKIAAIEAERDALRADAERYRHMRTSFARDIKHRLTWYLPALTPMTADGLDSAIDAAIAAKETK